MNLHSYSLGLHWFSLAIRRIVLSCSNLLVNYLRFIYISKLSSSIKFSQFSHPALEDNRFWQCLTKIIWLHLCMPCQPMQLARISSWWRVVRNRSFFFLVESNPRFRDYLTRFFLKDSISSFLSSFIFSWVILMQS